MNGNHFDIKGLFFVLKAGITIALFVVLISSCIRHFSDGNILQEVKAALANPFTQEATSSESNIQVIKEDSEYIQTRIIEQETIASQVPETGKFIGVDLDKMKLYTYLDGKMVKEYDVVSKGRPGSRWETPSGSYSVLYKNENHFSSIGEVYMPYSMQFFGNFFVHGWPTYPNGVPVGEGYSGGCIRLTTADSKEVFEFADIKTPIFVHELDPEEKSSIPQGKLKKIAPPLVSASSYIVADLETGEVFIEKNGTEPRPIASISKLMTALVANETISFQRLIYVSDNAVATHGTNGELYAGQSMTLHTILHPLLMESSNDAATAISEYLGTQTFVSTMNRKALALDMKDTKFADASGLSEHNVSTPQDLFKLAKYIYEKKKYLFDITTIPHTSMEIEGTGLRQSWSNNNPMVGREDFVGGKNGYTDAARKTLLTLYKMPIKEKDHVIAIIVLGSEDNAGDTLTLYSWLKKALELSDIRSDI